MDEEKILIGFWLQGEHLQDLDRVEPSDFPVYGNLVRKIKEIGCDPVRLGKLCNIPVSELMEMRGSHGETFYQSAMRELITKKARRYLEAVSQDVTISEIAERLNEFVATQSANNMPEPEQNITLEYIAEIDRRSAEKPVSWGMAMLDRYMGGVRQKELTTIGARPSTGKSAFLLQAAVGIANQDKKVLYIPLEMSTIETVERLVQGQAAVSQENLRRGKLNSDEWSKITVAADSVQKLEDAGNFLIFEGCNNLSTIKQLVKYHKPFAVVIDQLTQLNDNRQFTSKREQFSYMTNSLKRLAMAENVAVLLAAQVNRDAQGSEPTMANLKESGSIEEDSDNVILLHRQPDENPANPAKRTLIKIEKQRGGATGSINAVFMANRFRFYQED